MVNLPQPLRYEIYDYFVYDDRQAADIPARIDPAEHTPEAVVERMVNDGAICVKTYYEPGFGAFRGQLPTPTQQMIQDLVAAARARDMPVFIHANSVEAHAFALAAGVDSTAHGMWNGLPDGEPQLALLQEREIRPRRADDATRAAMVWLSEGPLMPCTIVGGSAFSA